MDDKILSGRLQYRNGKNSCMKYITNQIVIFKPGRLNKEDINNYFSFLPYSKDGTHCDCGGKINYLWDKIDNNYFINWTNSLFSDKGNLYQQFGNSPNLEEHFSDINSITCENLKNYIHNDNLILNKKNPFCEIFHSETSDINFLHLRAGTNWVNYDIKKRNKLLINFLKNLLAVIFFL